MRKWYFQSVLIAILFILPLSVGFFLLLWKFQVKNDPGWGDIQGRRFFLSLPAIICIGAVPFAFCQLGFMWRYGPKLELMPAKLRWFLELLPMTLWLATSILAIIVYASVSGRELVPMSWW